MIQNHPLSYWLAAILLPDIGPRSVLRWMNSFSSIENLFSATQEEWRSAGIPEKHFPALRQPHWKAVEKELAWGNESDHHLIAFSDPDYPTLLKEITDPPLVLYVLGNKAALQQKQIAMVGARNATPIGLENAEQFACHLAQAGFVITSGLALGVDGASHRGALAGKGMTIAVMGTGQHHIYPRSHQGLAKAIVNQGGAIISEFPLNATPNAVNFPRRNRVISGLSLGVLLVEAALKSGSLITARHAMEQNREVFAIPGSIHNPLSRGCHHLIRQGAKLVETATDILEELQCLNGQSVLPFSTMLEAPLNQKPTLPKHLRQLLDQVDYANTPFDVIVLRSGLTIGEVSSMLLSLTLEGYVQTVVGGYIRMAAVN